MVRCSPPVSIASKQVQYNTVPDLLRNDFEEFAFGMIIDNCETKFLQLHSIQIEAPPEGVASIDKSSQGRFRYIGTRSGTYGATIQRLSADDAKVPCS